MDKIDYKFCVLVNIKLEAKSIYLETDSEN